MKVLLLNGSPHKNGCTYTALNEISKTLNEKDIGTEIFWVGTKPITSCTACKKCTDKGHCVFDGDGVNEFVKKAYDADGFIIGSPVHYAAATGQITSFLGRAFYSNSNGDGKKAFKFKPASAIASARRAGTTVTYDQLNKFFGINEMPIISSSYWNMVHGNTPEEVMQDEEGLFVMRKLARNMAFFLECIELGKSNGIEVDDCEPHVSTNFIR